ncbi:MAG TPA: transglutaminase domain-containing protein [Mycobacteriales bacterium]|nr:transglutaminase domain-containing protein [Mycobacteriales bacterium]
MTIEAPPRDVAETTTDSAAVDTPTTSLIEPDDETEATSTISPREALMIGASAFLSSAGAGWMCSAVFVGAFPHMIALLGAFVGAGVVAVSYRTSRPALIQLLLVPITLVIGAILLVPYTGHGESLPGLVSQAVSLGGLQFAPVKFLPGWHFLLLLLSALIAGTAAAIATARGQARVATFIPLPLLFAASMIQPKKSDFLSTGIGLTCVIASLAVSYGVELSRESASDTSAGTSSRFELRRLLRAAAVMTGLGLVLVLIAQAGFLFPPVTPSVAVPPRHPQMPPSVPNKLLFTVRSPTAVPVRIGVLDGYADNGWETPPYDPSLVKKVPATGAVPVDAGVPVAPPAHSVRASGQLSVTFDVANLTGDVLPDVAEPESFAPNGNHLTFYPRTQMLQTAGTAKPGLTYTELAANAPSAKQMEAATPAPKALAEFTLAPPAPPAITALLAKAPANPFDRVQFLRTALYKAVIAKGAGVPANVSPADVVGMLSGKTATPYQIVGAEALLARWAGVPARIGYGYYNTTPKSPGVYEIYPSSGSDWLEAYFGGIGWVPLIGQPLHAEASLSQQKPKSNIQPSRQLALVVYVPIKEQNPQQLYTLVRWWVSVLAPYVVGLALLWTFWPGLVKTLRRRRRARWARRQGPSGRILAAYAGFRDVASDLRIATTGDLPLAFLHHVAADEEHEELAWLVTRALWGDLRRDVRPEDADAAERMAASVTRRVVTAQSATNRVVAFAARTSLREPYTWDIPALWRQSQPKRETPRRLGLRRRHALVQSPALGLVLMLFLAGGLLLSGCSSSTSASLPVHLPSRIAPAKLTVGSQSFQLQRELTAEVAYKRAGPASLVATGQVYTVRLNTAVQASLQVGAFKPDVDARKPAIRQGILHSFGLGAFRRTSLPGGQSIYQGTLPSQTVDVYIPPNGRYYDLFVAQQTFADAAAVFADLLGYQGEGS